MSTKNCFLYLENNEHPEIVEEVLKTSTENFEQFTKNVYFYSASKALFANRFDRLEICVLSDIRDAYSKKGFTLNEKVMTGPSDFLYQEE